MVETDITKWIKDGSGVVKTIGEGECEVEAKSPLTLWCPEEAGDNLELGFDCYLVTPHAKMLVMACARAWRGSPLIDGKRTGRYGEYNSGDLELYTVGFNRSLPSSGQIQPNADTANVRRIGGPDFVRFEGVSPIGDVDRWLVWNQASLLVSMRESVSGSARYYRYRMEFAAPIISYWLEEEKLFTVVDHQPRPLSGGNFGIRCMTTGAVFRIKNLAIKA